MNTIRWTTKASKQWRKLDKPIRVEILVAINENLPEFEKSPKVIHLTKHTYGYRLRVGDYRVLFNHDHVVKIVSIEEVRKRNEQTY